MKQDKITSLLISEKEIFYYNLYTHILLILLFKLIYYNLA